MSGILSMGAGSKYPLGTEIEVTFPDGAGEVYTVTGVHTTDTGTAYGIQATTGEYYVRVPEKEIDSLVDGTTTIQGMPKYGPGYIVTVDTGTYAIANIVWELQETWTLGVGNCHLQFQYYYESTYGHQFSEDDIVGLAMQTPGLQISGSISGIGECDCGKEKHGFSSHVTGCPAAEGDN